jgi:thiol-disulfide isomerase/thioredoxin
MFSFVMKASILTGADLVAGALLFPMLAFSQCEASAQIKPIVAAYTAVTRSRDPEAGREAAGAAILDKALIDAPTDYFLLDRKRNLMDNNTSEGHKNSIEWFATVHRKYPDSPAVTAVYADALRRQDPASALALLEASLKSHPEFPWTRFKLIPIFESGKLRNPERVSAEAEGFLTQCPGTSDAYIYRILLGTATEGRIARHAAALRERLSAAPDAPNQQLWEVLWDMEFKAAPPTGHAAVRERIANDLAKFEEQLVRQAAYLGFLRRGYANIGDTKATARLDRQIVEQFPDSSEAEWVVTTQWHKDHPFPKETDPATRKEYHRASAAAAHDWYQRWHNVLYLMQEFDAVAALNDTKAEDLLRLGQQYVAAYHATPNSFYGAMPMEFEVADSLIRKKALPPEIPAWIDEGYHRETNRPSRELGQLRGEMTEEQKARADEQIESMRIERARILLDYYDAIGQREKSRGIDDGLAGLNPSDQRLTPKLFEVRGKAAEMDNRKLDALVFYQAARATGGKPQPGRADPAVLEAKVTALWKDLGGTFAGLTVFGKAKLEPVSEIRWETPRNPLPAFSLVDLGGKTWTLADLNGKATLINVWATWCGPCRAEHTEFQKLYDSIKDRSDIAIMSLNVDEEEGLVAPYMAENHYTFPVLFGERVLEAVSGEGGVAIPQNWFVAPSAKLQFLQFGYGTDPQWSTTMTAKLQELLKGK